MRKGALTLPLAYGSIGGPSLNTAGEFSLVVGIRESQEVKHLSYHSDPDPVSELIHPQICIIYIWLECMKWPVWQDLHDTGE